MNRAANSRRQLTVAALVLALILSAWVAAQDRLTFSAKVEAVRVDVLVTDHGQPVTGLGAADFEVFDNGVRQQARLASFDIHRR
jgi:hypothetical protein